MQAILLPCKGQNFLGKGYAITYYCGWHLQGHLAGKLMFQNQYMQIKFLKTFFVLLSWSLG